MSKITDQIAELLTQVTEDSDKAAAGNHSAGTRARLGFQAIKKLCQEGRDEIKQQRDAKKKAA